MAKFGFTKEEIITNVHHEIEKIRLHSDTWLDAIIEFCHDNDIEEDKITKYLSPAILEHLTNEAIERKYVKNIETHNMFV